MCMMQGTIQCRENGEMPRNGAENETSCGRLSSQIDKEINAHNFTEKRPTENISLQHMVRNCLFMIRDQFVWDCNESDKETCIWNACNRFPA